MDTSAIYIKVLSDMSVRYTGKPMRAIHFLQSHNKGAMKNLISIALLIYPLALLAAPEVSFSIWDPGFKDNAQILLPCGFVAIVFFVIFARLTKPYEAGHLLCGIILIIIGMGAIYIALGNQALMSVFFDANALTKNGKEMGSLNWMVFQITIPALAFSFGTRFVGNWVTIRAPDRQ